MLFTIVGPPRYYFTPSILQSALINQEEAYFSSPFYLLANKQTIWWSLYFKQRTRVTVFLVFLRVAPYHTDPDPPPFHHLPIGPPAGEIPAPTSGSAAARRAPWASGIWPVEHAAKAHPPYNATPQIQGGAGCAASPLKPSSAQPSPAPSHLAVCPLQAHTLPMTKITT